MVHLKLVASLILRNENDRFLKPCVESLQTFCDEIRAVDDNSNDGSYQTLQNMGVEVVRNDRSMFYEHEGRARQRLLEWTMEGNPTHVLAIDADEFVADGQALRAALEAPTPMPTAQERRQRRALPAVGVWGLQMQEIWGAGEEWLSVRQDGGWKEHPVPIVFAVPTMNRQTVRHWRIPDRALACGRVPTEVAARSNRGHSPAVTQLLHFGWACESDRHERHHRYVVHDGGAHHASKHLDSIMWVDRRVLRTRRAWPESLVAAKPGLLERINR